MRLIPSFVQVRFLPLLPIFAGAKDLLIVHAVRASLSRCRALAMGDAPETATTRKAKSE